MLKVLVVVVLFAVATYCLVRVIERRGVARPGRAGEPGQRPRQQPRRGSRAQHRPVAPDDDEDFLRDLDRKRRHPEDPEAG